ncbi:MAG: flagellar protein FlbB [Treponemataceae bacterium]|nr:flagellar protein FlbB [Treponemataceae bacterium]
MASGVGKTIGKTIALLLLLIILVFVGLMWFDFLGVIQAKSLFAPVYKVLKLKPQESKSVANVDESIMANLDDDRISKRIENLDLREQELNKKQENLEKLEAVNLQVSQELEDLRNSQEEREKTFNNAVKKYDDREVNIVQNAKNLNSMAPDKAVAILNAMEDQDVIDTLRKVEELAQESGTASQVSYWLSLMPAERVAVLNRKMVSKPSN